MALIKCPNCGTDVSEKAKQCPNCGETLQTQKVEKVCEECGYELDDNTTICPKCGCPVPESEEQKKTRKKKKIISSAIEKYGLYDADALTVLSSVGGLDIAGMAGACIGCAVNSVPVVLDGAISLAAALTAERLVPGVRQYLIASHKSREASAGLLAKALGLEPVIDADMALGEGTGALMLFPLIDTALSLYNNGLTFDEIGMEGYKRFGR